VEIASSVRDTLVSYRRARKALANHGGALSAAAVADIEEQLSWLVYDGFVDDVSVQWLSHLSRYLDAVVVRVEQARLDPATDLLRQKKVEPFWSRYLDCEFDYSEPVENWRYLLEEYRVSVFAQGLKTSVRVSARRLEQAWEEVLQYQMQVSTV